MSNPINILLVEDDRDDIELFENALLENSVLYNMHTLMQGDKIIPWLNNCKNFPDIIVMDLNIPKLHGREILIQIKESTRFRSIPLVILSTSSSPKEKEFCLAKGADSFITKPTTLKGFNETVATITKIARGQNISNS